MKSALPSRVPEAAPLVLLVALLVGLVFLGGSVRYDAASQAFIRPLAILAGAAAILLPSESRLRAMRWPLAMLGALAAYMALQLVPLPPAIWTALPGRDLFASLAEIAGVEQPWRPISIAPDLTLNSLLSLTVPVAALIVLARLPRRHWFVLICLLLALIGISGLFGLAQLSGRMDELYLYRVSSRIDAVGLFANRNHQAVLLAMAPPLLAAFARWPIDPPAIDPRTPIAGLALLFVVPLVLVTGSRAGLLAMAVGCVFAWFIWRSPVPQRARADARARRRERSPLHRFRRYGALGIAAAIAGALLVTVLVARAEALQRLFAAQAADEKRATLLGEVLQLARDHLPFGSGFGSFDPIFRTIEPFGNLGPKYFNHAHNDWVELVIEGGLPALVLLVLFIGWFARRSIRYWRSPGASVGRAELLGRTGSALVVIIGLASVFDYPLRTPLLAAVFAFAIGFLCLEPAPGSAGRATVDRRDANH